MKQTEYIKHRKTPKINIPILIILIFFLISCTSNQDGKRTKESTSDVNSEELQMVKFSHDLIGIYHGIQPGYVLKDRYGDELIIDGKRIHVPSIDYKFEIGENGNINLEQINLEDNDKHYYKGCYKIIVDDNNEITIKCFLIDNQGSNPKCLLRIDKTLKKATYIAENEPQFKLERI